MKLKRSYKDAGFNAVCICMTAFLVINLIVPLRRVEAVETPESKISVEFSSTLNPDKTEAKIKIKASSKGKDMKVVGINLPDGSYADGSEAVYTADSNGWQSFVVVYDETVKATDSDAEATPAEAAHSKDKKKQEKDEDQSLLNWVLPKVYALTVDTDQGTQTSGGDAAKPSVPQAGKAEQLSNTDKKQEVDQPSGSIGKPEPDKPAKPEPDKPAKPEPDKPAKPEPDKPAKPEPDKPAKPEPDKPAKPEPDKPANPEPDKPVNPEPDKPVNPEPDKPAKPEPDKPANPEPDKPANPEPDKPANPETDKPANPETDKPVNPETDKPATPEPNKPSNPSEEDHTGEIPPSGGSGLPGDDGFVATPNIKPEDPNQRPIPHFDDDEDDDLQVIRRSQEFRYEVTGLLDGAFVQRAAFPEDGMEVCVKADQGVLPEGANAKITRITDEDQLENLRTLMEQELPSGEIIYQTVFYDIVILDENGEEIQPDQTKGQVKVMFNRLDAPKAISEEEEDDGSEELTLLDEPEELGTSRKIAVFDRDNNAEFLDTVETEEGVEAQAPHFSVYGVATTKGFTATAALTDSNTGTKVLATNTVYTVTPSAGKNVVTVTSDKGVPINIGPSNNGSNVVINIPKGVTLNVTAREAGQPAISLPSANRLIIVGGGTLVAQGGPAGPAGSGSNGGTATYQATEPHWQLWLAGNGGAGGAGGKGAGAGIGGYGGSGGYGGNATDTLHNGQDIVYQFGGLQEPLYGQSGWAGGNGGAMGTLYALGDVTVDGRSGAPSSAGQRGLGGGGEYKISWYVEDPQVSYAKNTMWYGGTGGAGGGAGGGGFAASGIGGGGAGGGGGGSGSSGAIVSTIVNAGDLERVPISEAVYLGGNGGSGGAGSTPGQGGKESRIYGADVQGPGGGQLWAGSPGFTGTKTNGGGPVQKTATFRQRDFNTLVTHEATATIYAGAGGDAGQKGDDGRVFKSSSATVKGRTGPLSDGTETHPDVTYKLSGIADPPQGGRVTGGGDIMYGKQGTLTAVPTDATWVFNEWDDGNTNATINVTMDQFGDIQRTAHFSRPDMAMMEWYRGDLKGNYISRIVPKGEDVTIKFKVKRGDSEITTKPTVTIAQWLSGQVYGQLTWGTDNISTLAKYTMPKDGLLAGVYAAWIDQKDIGHVNIITSEIQAPPGKDMIFTLKSAATAASDLASDTVNVYIDKGQDSPANTTGLSTRAVRVLGFETPSQGVNIPFEIVTKQELIDNRNIWGPDEAQRKIAVEINGRPFTPNMELKAGVNAVTIYNANNLPQNVGRRVLSMELTPQSNGEKVFIDFRVDTQGSTEKTLTIDSEAPTFPANPITGAVQAMPKPVVTGADGTPKPAFFTYNLQAQIPAPGYYFMGWYDGDTLLSRELNYPYMIPTAQTSKKLIAKYVPKYVLNPNTAAGEYLVTASDNSFRYVFDVTQALGIGTGNYGWSDYFTDFRLVQAVGGTGGKIEAPVVTDNYTLKSWVGKNLDVQFDDLEAGTYYPKMYSATSQDGGGLTQDQPKGGLKLYKLGFAPPAAGEVFKKRLSMKASANVNETAKDHVTLVFEAPAGTTAATARIIKAEAGDEDDPWEIVPYAAVEQGRDQWGWEKAQKTIGLKIKGQEGNSGAFSVPLTPGEPFQVELTNANALKEDIGSELRLTIQMRKTDGGTATAIMRIPIAVSSTQINVTVPLKLLLKIGPDGGIVSPDSYAIKNHTSIPMTVEKVRMTRIGAPNLTFTTQPPAAGDLDKFYAVVNIHLAAPNPPVRLVLANMTSGADQTVNWDLGAATAAGPAQLPIDFEGSYVSNMTGGWPQAETEIFSMSYVIVPKR